MMKKMGILVCMIVCAMIVNGLEQINPVYYEDYDGMVDFSWIFYGENPMTCDITGLGLSDVYGIVVQPNIIHTETVYMCNGAYEYTITCGSESVQNKLIVNVVTPPPMDWAKYRID